MLRLHDLPRPRFWPFVFLFGACEDFRPQCRLFVDVTNVHGDEPALCYNINKVKYEFSICSYSQTLHVLSTLFTFCSKPNGTS